MYVQVERTDIDPSTGRCRYYVSLKPDMTREDSDAKVRVAVEAAISVSETGELADVSFALPKKYRSQTALTFISKLSKSTAGAKQAQGTVSYVAPRVFIAVPGYHGDAVFAAPANLEVDAAGRIIGLEID
ncbi:MAG: hypothetical protein ACRD2Q_01280 [Terriglobales bacterium]